MADLSAEERERVGLTPDVRLELFEERPAPSSLVGQAFSGAKSLTEVLELLPAEPDFDPVFADPRLGDVQRWLSLPGIYRLPWSADVGEGERAAWGERQIVDARRRPALVRLHVDGDVFIARLAVDGATLYRAHVEPRRRIEVPSEPPEVVVPTPQLAPLLGDRAAPRWLQAAFDELAGSPYAPSRVAAVGLVVRGWGPSSKEERDREIERLIVGEDDIATHARHWMRALEPEVRREVESSSIDDALELPDRLRGLVREDDEKDGVPLGLVVAALVRARDDLASVDVALGLVGEGVELRRTLADVDDELLIHGTLILDMMKHVRAHLGVERLEALARMDLGESWWLSRL